MRDREIPNSERVEIPDGEMGKEAAFSKTSRDALGVSEMSRDSLNTVIYRHLQPFTVIYSHLPSFTAIHRHFTVNLDTFGVAIQEVLPRKLSPKWRCNNHVVFTGQTGLLASPGAAGSGRRRPTPPFTSVIAHRSTFIEHFFKTLEKS